MPDLKLLGTPLIQGRDGPLSGPAAQSHRLALLALLVVAPDHTLSRDKLIALLWPDRSTTRARNSLNVSVHAIRSALGHEVLRSVSDALRLDPTALTCDVLRFEAALEDGKPEEAVAEYTGPFLDGFHLEGSVEFSQWVDRIRARLARAYEGALETLAERAEERSEPSSAVAWWRRRADQDPHNARVTLRLMEALATAGNRAAALERARIHARHLETEFGARPSPEVEELAERLREGPREAGLPPQPGASPLESDGSSADDAPAPPGADYGLRPDAEARYSEGKPEEEGAAWEPTSGSDGPSSDEREPKALRLLAAGAIIVVLGGIAMAWGRERVETPAVSPRAEVSDAVVTVFPFRYQGSPRYEYLGRGISDLISTMLDGTGALRSTDPSALSSALRREEDPGAERAAVLARSLGAGRLIRGVVTEVGGRLQLRAMLYDASLTPLARADVVAPREDSIFQAVDELVRRLLADELRRTGRSIAGLAALTTRSVRALEAYLRGERLSRRGDADGATAAFREAVARDSLFALAYYRLAISTAWGRGESLPAARRALGLAERLPPTERTLLRAYVLLHTGGHREAERIYRSVLDREPGNAVAARGLARVLHHFSALTGRPQRVAEAAWRRALELQPRDMWSLYEASTIAARLRRLDWLDSLIALAEELSPNERWTTVMRARRAFASDVPEEEARALADLRRGTQVLEAAARVALQGDLRDAQRIIRLGQSPEREPFLRGLAFLGDAAVEAALGRPTSARALLGRGAQKSVPEAALALEATVAVASWASTPEPRLRQLRDRLLGTTDREMERADYVVTGATVRSYLLGMLAVRLGDREQAESQAARLDSLPPDEEVGSLPRDLAASIRAHDAATSGDLEGALALLAAMDMQVPLGLLLNSMTGGLPHARLLRADILRALGRHGEALAWYESAVGVATIDLLNAAPAQLGMAHVLDALGEPERARGHYTRFVELWKDPDPDLQPVVRHARLRLQAPDFPAGA